MKIGIFDLRGHSVARLVDREFTAGERVVDWNGRSIDGRELGTGTYLVRVVIDGRVEVGKVQLVR